MIEEKLEVNIVVLKKQIPIILLLGITLLENIIYAIVFVILFTVT